MLPFLLFAFYIFRLATLLRAVVQLFEHLFQLVGDGQTEVGGVLQDAEAVIGNRPEDDGSAQDTRLVQDMHLQHLGDAHHQEGQHLPAEAADHQLKIIIIKTPLESAKSNELSKAKAPGFSRSTHFLTPMKPDHSDQMPSLQTAKEYLRLAP